MKKQFPCAKRHKTALRALLVMLLCAAPVLGVPNHAAALIDGHYTTASLSVQERSAGNLLNSDRTAYGLAPLTLDPELCRIARIKSEDMRDNQYFAHTSPTYGDVRDMLSHFGYAYQAAGENIANHATVEKAQAALISSPGHRRNILSTTYTKVGIGVALDQNGYVYLTQIFAN